MNLSNLLISNCTPTRPSPGKYYYHLKNGKKDGWADKIEDYLKGLQLGISKLFRPTFLKLVIFVCESFSFNARETFLIVIIQGGNFII